MGLKIPLMKRSRVANSGMDLQIPAHFRCPISLDLMRDPVTAATGITYDRQSIETWLELGNGSCPVTARPVANEELIPNHAIRRMIQDWCVSNRGLGIERIPTPRVPVTRTDVAEILQEIAVSGRRGDGPRCGELAGKLKGLGKESERNRRCIASGGAARVLSASLSQLAGESIDASRSAVFQEILSALTVFSPLDEESLRHIGSRGSLRSIVSILRNGDLAGRLSAVLVLKELVSSLHSEGIDAVARTDGLSEALVKLIEKPISPQATKVSLIATYYMVSSSNIVASKFVELGLVPLLLENLVDAEKSVCEKALGVLDGLFSCERGRERGYDNALAVPVLVKKMFRVSDLATEFAVSALWKLCRNYNKEAGKRGGDAGGCLNEALQVGAFQKLLLLLQVGCSGSTKERASDLLKILNGSRGSAECIESVDFKGLKRSF
ncbi:U-box domain-containing protein 21-like [Ananas comosus]|uniref:U-box domain-containing protein n=1 Tax=Ananas comosus TaxID=4615 RepID=A0A6P5FCZ0_ANACO|nr:U-box domain-containing protein 21-like [Ananas comosus]